MKPLESASAFPGSEPRVPSGVARMEPELANPEPGTRIAAIHDCWNLIGVEGNRTCRELLKFTHCRNCPVYSAAGMQLLDRPISAGYRREHAEHYAQQKRITQATRLSVVIFRLANEWLALPTTVVQEVSPPCKIPQTDSRTTDGISKSERRPMHSLPHRRGGVAPGLVNVRGELLVCVSAARLLGVPSSEFRVPGSAVP